MDDDASDEPVFDTKSKSQIKRELHALQDLGQRLTKLKPEQQARLPITEPLAQALREAPKHSSNSAHKRHIQYIGKLMREQDIDAIGAVLEQINGSNRAYNERFHAMERWRDRLLEEGDRAVQEFFEQFPQADLQHLRNLLRQARQERERNKPPAAARNLFKYLRELLDSL